VNIQSGRHEEEWPTVARETSLIGCIGVLIIATRGAAGPGEVLVKIRGGSEAYLAWSQEPLPKGTTVLVIESRGNRAVDVSEWADPLAPLSDDPLFPG
jgi:membrane protein implicated in regulation of membrane protease activity